MNGLCTAVGRLFGWPACVSLFCVIALPLYAQEVSEAPRCLLCHRDTVDERTRALTHAPHAGIAGGGAAGCVACHGSSLEHQKSPGRQGPDIGFSSAVGADATAANQVCLDCHQDSAATYWLGGVHDDGGVACSHCHSSHQRRDPALDTGQAMSICLGCHRREQAQLRLPSRHPIHEGKTDCTDCHNPHGSPAVAMLREPTINDNCYSCHQEKRGPHLWEHQPVTENCGYCHLPHGAVQANLLRARSPFLCQQCHSAAAHPSQLYDGGAARAGTSNAYMLGKSCLNCHGQIHGSNHPSGARLTR